jgi:hypothetical protein
MERGPDGRRGGRNGAGTFALTPEASNPGFRETTEELCV